MPVVFSIFSSYIVFFVDGHVPLFIHDSLDVIYCDCYTLLCAAFCVDSFGETGRRSFLKSVNRVAEKTFSRGTLWHSSTLLSHQLSTVTLFTGTCCLRCYGACALQGRPPFHNLSKACRAMEEDKPLSCLVRHHPWPKKGVLCDVMYSGTFWDRFGTRMLFEIRYHCRRWLMLSFICSLTGWYGSSSSTWACFSFFSKYESSFRAVLLSCFSMSLKIWRFIHRQLYDSLLQFNNNIFLHWVKRVSVFIFPPAWFSSLHIAYCLSSSRHLHEWSSVPLRSVFWSISISWRCLYPCWVMQFCLSNFVFCSPIWYLALLYRSLLWRYWLWFFSVSCMKRKLAYVAYNKCIGKKKPSKWQCIRNSGVIVNGERREEWRIFARASTIWDELLISKCHYGCLI